MKLETRPIRSQRPSRSRPALRSASPRVPRARQAYPQAPAAHNAHDAAPQARLRRRSEWCQVTLGALVVESLLLLVIAGVTLALGAWPLTVIALMWLMLRVTAASLSSGYRHAKHWHPVWQTIKFGAVTVLGLMAFSPQHFGPTAALLLAGLVAMTLAGHAATRFWLDYRAEPTRVFVIARPRQMRAAVNRVAAPNTLVHRSVGTMPTDPHAMGAVLAVEALEHVIDDLIAFAPDRVVVFPNSMSPAELRELSWAIEEYDIELNLELEVEGIAAHRLVASAREDSTALTIKPRRNLVGTPLMRLVDVAGAASVLLLGLPVMLLIALMIRLDSRGPVFFRQERVGQGGQPFTMLKFRSMHVNAEEMLADVLAANEVEGGVLFKMKEDPRVTRVGRLLRKTSLDELPQLLNVLGGSMSLIGPRPALPREVAEYNHTARRRLAVRPGLTGLWQVSGRSNLGFNEAVQLDLDYVDNWSPRLEFDIALRTVGAVVRGEGAY